MAKLIIKKPAMSKPRNDAVAPVPLNPRRVRYIKLGAAGCWEADCLKSGTIRISFDSGRDDRFALCKAGLWDKLKQAFVASGNDKGTAARFANELRLFFEDDGSTLWITFHGERLHWGLVDKSLPLQHTDQHSVYRVIHGGWQSSDLSGEPLTKDRLSGALTKLAAYRGTSCSVKDTVQRYLVRRINGEKQPDLDRVLRDLRALKLSISELMRRLDPQDFETLVDLVFTASGWRRLTRVGGPQKTIDLDLLLPSTGERAFVQIKTRSNSAELNKYIGQFEQMDQYDRMFYVYHSGTIEMRDDLDGRVTVIDRTKLADMIINAGLSNWVTEKTL